MNKFNNKAVVLSLVMFAFLAMSLAVMAPVSAQVVPDDLCLRVTIQEDESGPLPAVERFRINIHLESNNGIHFKVWGKVRIPQENFYVGGTGILEGDVLTMNLTSSQRHTDGWRDTGVMQVRYNIVTGRGVFYEIGHDFDSQSRNFDQRYTAGILRPCP